MLSMNFLLSYLVIYHESILIQHDHILIMEKTESGGKIENPIEFPSLIRYNESKEGYLIQYSFKRDRKKGFIHVSHHQTRDGERDRKVHDRIDFVIDLEKPQLNFSEESKKICEKCPRCEEYFLPLDKFNMSCKDYDGKSSKDILGIAVKNFEQKLKDLKFFDKFNLGSNH